MRSALVVRSRLALLAAAATLGACDDDGLPEAPDAGLEAPATDAATGAADAGLTPDAGPGGIVAGAARITPERLDFGAMVVGRAHTATVTVENLGSTSMPVRLAPPSVQGRGFGTWDIALAFELAPGERRVLPLTLTATAVGSLVGTIAIDTCNGACPVAILLSGEGVDAGTVCDAALDFGLVNVDACVERKINCENLGAFSEVLRDLRVVGNPDFTLGSTLAASVAAGATFEVDVRWCPRSGGAASAALELELEGATREVALTGRAGGADLRCAPIRFDLGSVPLGAAVPLAMTCANVGLGVAELSLDVPPAGLAWTTSSPVRIPAGASEVLQASFQPLVVGAYSEEFVIRTNDPDTAELRVAVTATGVERAPCQPRIEPNPVLLGHMALSTTHPAAFSIVNDGTGSCTLTGISAPSHVRVLGPTSGVVAPSASLEVALAYEARSAGSLRDTVEARFSDGSVAAVELRGEVETGTWLPRPGRVEFGARPVGCTPSERVLRFTRLSGSGTVSRVALAAGSPFSLGTLPALPARVEAGDSLDIPVRFTPTASGDFEAVVEVEDDAGGIWQVSLHGSGTTSGTRTDTYPSRARSLDLVFAVDAGEPSAALRAALAERATLLFERLASAGVDARVAVFSGASGALVGTQPWVSDAAGLRARLDELTPSASGPGFIGTLSSLSGLRASAELVVGLVSARDEVGTSDPAAAALALSALATKVDISSLGAPSDLACASDAGALSAAPRLAALAWLSGGEVYSACAGFAAAFEAALADWARPTTFALEELPLPASLTVRAGGQSVPRWSSAAPGGFVYGSTETAVAFVDPSLPRGVDALEVSYLVECASGSCGDGVLQSFEQCDDGNAELDDACVECADASCGDGLVWSGSEACDDGNLAFGDACLPGCVPARCGDGYVQAGVEECDEGGIAGGCPSSCRYYSVRGPTLASFDRIRRGTLLSFSGGSVPESEGIAQIQLPFSFDFYGSSTSTLTVSPNGVLGVGVFPQMNHWLNGHLPDSARPNGIIAPWWDDLIVDTEVSRQGATVGWDVRGNAPNRTLIVQWRDVRLAAQSSNAHRRWQFQVQIDEATSEIRFHYGDTDQRSNNFPSTYSASVGIESPDGRLGIEALSCTPSCDGRPSYLGSSYDYPQSTVIRFIPEP